VSMLKGKAYAHIHIYVHVCIYRDPYIRKPKHDIHLWEVIKKGHSSQACPSRFVLSHAFAQCLGMTDASDAEHVAACVSS